TPRHARRARVYPDRGRRGGHHSPSAVDARARQRRPRPGLTPASALHGHQPLRRTTTSSATITASSTAATTTNHVLLECALRAVSAAGSADAATAGTDETCAGAGGDDSAAAELTGADVAGELFVGGV